MKRLLKLFINMLPILVLASLTGCLHPHSEPRSSEVWGRVLDANTRAPIQGAEIRLNQSPHHSVFSDKNGYFRLKAAKNFIWARVPPDANWPNEKDNIMEILHPNYEPVWGTWGGDIGDIFLKPKSNAN